MINSQYYSAEILEHLRIIHESDNEAERNHAIQAIVHFKQNDKTKKHDKARLFIKVFQSVAWRDTHASILRALGETQEQRGVEFLIRFIRETHDLPLATQAVLGLGYSQTSLAGEFLISLLNETGSRLRQEAIVGLALMPHFHCDPQLLGIIEDNNSSDTLKLFAVIAAGRRGAKNTVPAILNLLQHEQGKLFNAALLALGHLATEDQIDKACQRDTTYQLFADELKLYAKDRSYLRSQQKTQEIVVGVLNDKKLSWSTRFRLLREFPRDQVWDALKSAESDTSNHTECLLRAATNTPERVEDDIEFLVKNHESIEYAEFAILARLCIGIKNDDFIMQLKPLHACKLLTQVYVQDALKYAQYFFSPVGNEPLALAYINALVAQSFMTFKPNLLLMEFMLKNLGLSTGLALRARIIRGLAQMGCTEKTYIDELNHEANNAKSISWVYYSVGLLPVTCAYPFFSARFFHLLESENNTTEVSDLLNRIASLGHFNDAHFIEKIPETIISKNVSSVLEILAHNVASNAASNPQSNATNEYDDILERKLLFGNHSEKLLALSAIALNGTDRSCEFLFDFLKSKNHSLRERSLHGLCLRGNCSQHARLLLWFEAHAYEPHTALKILNTLSSKQNEDYTPVVRILERFIQQKNGPFIDDEILAEALSLHDTLDVLSSKMKFEVMEEAGNTQHQQDIFLARDLPAYPRYSETIKLILRNAELTWHHTELFNNLVDKSTMLIQYNKSTDLLLQQRLGYRLFHNASNEFLAQLQGRIMELGLDNANVNNFKLIRHLNLEGFFLASEFPAHKLRVLAESIMNGKILQDRFRIIDGLRAWSLIVLLFARTFKVGDKEFTPLFPMRFSGQEKINSIVKLMNKFQDLRNSAAHHGILVELKQLAEIRSDSFTLLNELEEVLGD
jgi:HEAT repeat protein